MQGIRSEISAQQVSYKASGFCKRLRQSQVRQQGASTFDNFDRNATELYRFNWTSVGAFNPTTKSTFEEISAPPPRIWWRRQVVRTAATCAGNFFDRISGSIRPRAVRRPG